MTEPRSGRSLDPRPIGGGGTKALLVMAAVVVVLVGLSLASAIVVPIVFAAFAAAATSPITGWLTDRKVPNGVAVVIVIVGSLAVIGALGMLLASALMDMNDSLPSYLAAVTDTQHETAGWLDGHGMERLAATVSAFDLETWVGDLVTNTLLAGAPDLLSSVFITLLVIAFILLESAAFRGKVEWSERLGGAKLGNLAHTVREIQKYLAVKTGVSGATGLGIGAWTAAWGLEHALLWGLLGFALNFIPSVGSFIAAIPPVLVAWAEFGPGTALAIAAGIAAVNLVLGNIVEPKLMGRALGLSPLVVILSMIVWGFVLGPIGAVLSAPLTMVVKIALLRTEDLRWVAVLLGPPRSDEWHARHSLPGPPLLSDEKMADHVGGAPASEAR